MNTALGFSALVGVVLPVVISYLKNTAWTAKAKQLLSVGISLVAGIGITLIDNGVQFDWSNTQAALANVAVVFTVAQTVYFQYFGNTSTNARLENSGVGGQ